jgi:hypothetical protein
MAPIDQLAPPPNPTDRPSSAPPIGRAPGGGNQDEPSHPTSSTESPLVPDISIHGPGPSIPRVSSAVQDSNESVLPHLDPAAPRAVAHSPNRQPPPDAQTSSASQDVNDAAPLHSNFGIPTASNPIHRRPSPTPTTTTLQGATESILHPSFIDISAGSIQVPLWHLISQRKLQPSLVRRRGFLKSERQC